VKVLEVLKVVQGVDVVATKASCSRSCFFKAFFILLTTVNFGLLSLNVVAATLPVDSVDILYHGYDGGGMDINGPFVLMRKSIGTQVSVNGHYYVDSVSAASIDVVTSGASEYTEERTELSAGVDYLHEKTMLSVGYTESEENDFLAKTVFMSVNQDFFGDLSKVTMAYSRGWDEISKIGDEVINEADRQNFKIGFSQILTKSSLMGFDVETITDEGFLQNPYRSYRLLSADKTEWSNEPEHYPDTHTSTAVAIRGLYYLPYRASIKAEYRFFSDSWGVKANTYELLYVHPLGDAWTLEAKVRYYSQTQADFYSDLFEADTQDFKARDKELSTYSDITYGAGVTYELGKGFIPYINKMKFTLLVDYLEFDYDNFRDASDTSLVPGTEPFYHFDAWVTRASFTLEY